MLARAPAHETLFDSRMLAELSGGTLTEAGPGSSSVSFLGRTIDEDLAAIAEPQPQSQPAPLPAPIADPEPPDVDALYDTLLRRLRRELLDERERRGRSIGEGRW